MCYSQSRFFKNTNTNKINFFPTPNPKTKRASVCSPPSTMAAPTWFCLWSLTLLLVSHPHVSANSEGDALYTLRKALSDPDNVLQSWDPTLVNPCTWFHITCNQDNRVTRLYALSVRCRSIFSFVFLSCFWLGDLVLGSFDVMDVWLGDVKCRCDLYCFDKFDWFICCVVLELMYNYKADWFGNLVLFHSLKCCVIV